MQVIKVRAESNPAGVAGAIANSIRSLGYALERGIEVKVVGERAVYVAVRALGQANEYLAAERPAHHLGHVVSSETVTLNDRSNTMITFRLFWIPKEAP